VGRKNIRAEIKAPPAQNRNKTTNPYMGRDETDCPVMATRKPVRKWANFTLFGFIGALVFGSPDFVSFTATILENARIQVV